MLTQPKPSLGDWIAGARPRTLPAAIVPVAVGAGVAIGTDGADVVWWRVLVALAVSLLLQIGVNYANDYSDGVRGTDNVRVGPMRLVASGTATPSAVKRAALGCLGLAAVAGLTLAATTSWWLLLIGLAAILAAWGYTGGPKPYGYLGLGELFVFTFFGLVATVGTTYVAIEDVPWVAWPAACGVGFLACALLVVNNLRDIPTDTVAGKRTLAVRVGDQWTRRLYLGLIVGAILLGFVCSIARPWSAMAAFAGIAAFVPVRRVLACATGRELIAVLGATARVQLAYGALLAVGLALG
ncbi:MAG TPA: 1,4-dihydroxy-2-naphthoate polyprenyltransferase [Ilumatobacter sp.]|jgi:1,4-dihydroxy-2-naphthoate octaprenyltransferase|nr:1,4-dihydroxy-2-naphthoate polyprenyltransferase [Ilumatobacter sp.]